MQEGKPPKTDWDEGISVPIKAGTFPSGDTASPMAPPTISSLKRVVIKHTYTQESEENRREELRSMGRASLFYYPKMQSIEGTYNNEVGGEGRSEIRAQK